MLSKITATQLQQMSTDLPLPSWAQGIRILPADFFSQWWAKNSEEFSPYLNIPRFPLSSVGYTFDLDSPLSSLIRNFGLSRLGGIGQLGFLTQPSQAEELNAPFLQRYPHTRLTHSIDATVLIILMLMNNQHVFDESDCLHGMIATLLHDHGTPAGGDTTKLLDANAFDEDLHFARIFQSKEASQCCASLGLSPDRLTAIVQEKNLLGQLKDVADKLAYTCRDARTFLDVPIIEVHQARDRNYEGIEQILTGCPSIGDLWEDVSIENGRIVFTNPDRLFAFLLLRAALFHDLYYNPASRSFDFVVREVLMQEMYAEGILTQSSLLSMHDSQLVSSIRDWSGIHLSEIHIKHLSGLGHHVFKTRDEAESFATSKRKETPFVLVEDFSSTLGTGTSWLVQTPEGPRPLNEVQPTDTALIEEIATDARRIIVHWLDTPHPDLLTKLREAQAA